MSTSHRAMTQSWIWAVIAGVIVGPTVGAVFAILKRSHLFWRSSALLVGCYFMAATIYNSRNIPVLEVLTVLGIALIYRSLWYGMVAESVKPGSWSRILLRGAMLSLCAAPVGYAVCIFLTRLFAIVVDRPALGNDTAVNVLSAVCCGAIMPQLFGSDIHYKQRRKWGFALAVGVVAFEFAWNIAIGNVITACAFLLRAVAVLMVRLLVFSLRVAWLAGVAVGFSLQNLYLIYASKWFNDPLLGLCSVLVLWIAILQLCSWRFPDIYEWIEETLAMKPVRVEQM